MIMKNLTLRALALSLGRSGHDGGDGRGSGVRRDAAGKPTGRTGTSVPYWHVFAAYALVIMLIGGWAVSIARRLRAIEERLLD